MPWTAVPTFTSGQVLTAAQMNGIGNDLTVLRGDFGLVRRASGSMTLNSATWASLPAGTWDITLAAAAGDIVEVALSGLALNENVDIYFDVVTVVGSTVTNSFGGNGSTPPSNGITGWRTNAARIESISGNFFYKLVSGDISSGNVTVRLRYQTSSAVNRTLFSETDIPLTFFARNHGPVEI